MTADREFYAPLALLESGLSSTAIHVWVWVAGHARPTDGKPAVRHGVEPIAAALKLRPKQVRDALSELAAAEWIVQCRRAGHRPQYSFKWAGVS